MSTSIALSAAASSQAAVAQDTANRALCTAQMSTFADATASISAKQAYASCVNLLHPTTSIFSDPVFKIFAGALLVAFILGIAHSMLIWGRSRYVDYVQLILLPLVWLFAVFCIELLIGLLIFLFHVVFH